MNYTPRLAYICMEFGVEPAVKTYSGGLGILAGDTIKTYADMGLEAIGVGILYKNGYLSQQVDPGVGQINHPQSWDHTQYMSLIGHTIIPLKAEKVEVDIWEYVYTSPLSEREVSVLYLDTDLPQNSELFRQVSHNLYSANSEVFDRQLIVLGLGSWYALKELNLLSDITTFHLNESHSALLSLVLDPAETQVIFTTHTPLKGGHTRLPLNFIDTLCTNTQCLNIPEKAIEDGGVINLTTLALELADYSNAVSTKHQEVTQHMFPGYQVDAITNGIHVNTWISPAMREAIEPYVPGFDRTPQMLRYVETVPLERIRVAHQTNRKILHKRIVEVCGQELIPEAFTIGFARRATAYKRATMILANPEQLLALAHEKGGLNLVFAGKAYHEDAVGRGIIQEILRLDGQYSDSHLRIVYLADYDIELAQKMVAGVDVWLNTPQVSYEASGTSGMKASLNGVLNISVDDGWWIEGGIHGINGWTISGYSEAEELSSMYHNLAEAMTIFHEHPEKWTALQRTAISLIGSYFNTHRMLLQYILNGYSPSTLE